MGALSETLRGQRVYLDANVFIYALEGMEPWATPLRDIFAGLDVGESTAVTSELSVAECLVRPFSLGREDVARHYRSAFQPRPTLNVVPIHTDILVAAARLRAEAKLKLPDAIHAATALAQACAVLLTNDADFRRTPGIEVILLSEWVGH